MAVYTMFLLDNAMRVAGMLEFDFASDDEALGEGRGAVRAGLRWRRGVARHSIGEAGIQHDIGLN